VRGFRGRDSEQITPMFDAWYGYRTNIRDEIAEEAAEN
jgi:hypothetical protein